MSQPCLYLPEIRGRINFVVNYNCLCPKGILSIRVLVCTFCMHSIVTAGSHMTFVGDLMGLGEKSASHYLYLYAMHACMDDLSDLCMHACMHG